jgi:outer membrane protein assembly factor BamA
MFASCQFQYSATSNGLADLAFQIREAPAQMTFRMTVPGVEEAKLKAWLRQNAPLVQDKLPYNDEATNYYSRAIEQFLQSERAGEKVTVKLDTDLAKHETRFIFRPVNLPRITSIDFEGSKVIPADRLKAAMMSVAADREYTELDVRQWLDLNVRPLYENLGRLGVQFPAVKVASRPDGNHVALSVTVEEGPVYILGTTSVTGTQIPEKDLLAVARFAPGKTAEWNHILEGIDRMDRALRDQGYLYAKGQPVTSLTMDRIANLEVQYPKTQRFQFGELRINGIAPATAEKMKSMWTLKSGAPMKDSYVDQFIESAFASGVLGNAARNLTHQYEAKPGTQTVDVVIQFKQ